MTLLDQKLQKIYDENKFQTPFSNKDFENFKNFVQVNLPQSKFLNPFLFNAEYNVDYDTCLAILLFFTNSFNGEAPFLKLRPVIECPNVECKNTLFLTESEPFVYCPECDEDHEIGALLRHLKMLFEINPIFIEYHNMASRHTTYEKLKQTYSGLKHLPPSNTYNPTAKDLEGGVHMKRLEEINMGSDKPISPSLADFQRDLSKKMLQNKR